MKDMKDMKDTKKAFINELGTAVMFGVKDTDTADTHVVLYASGHGQEADWTITRKEADVLYKLLGKYLYTLNDCKE